MGDTVQEALRKRKNQEQTAIVSAYKKEQDSVAAALKARDQRISGEIDSIASNVISRYNSVINSYNKGITNLPTYGANVADVYKGQRETRLGVSDLLLEVEAYRKYFGDETTDAMITTLKDIQGGQDSILDSARFYSQWDTEDDYIKWDAAQKDYEAKVNLDLDAAEKEIAQLEAEFDDWMYGDNAYCYDATDTNERKKYDQMVAEWEKRISDKRLFFNQAKQIQEGITLSSVSGNDDFKEHSGYSSTKSDGWLSELTSQYGMGYDDLTYEYINNQNGIRDEIEQKYRTYSRDSAFSGGEPTYMAKGYDLLTDDEIAIYNYYYSRDGKEAAQKYLDNIQETLNYRKATGMYSHMEDNTALELAFGVAAGLDQFESGFRNAFNTEDDYIAQTAYQIASGMVRENLADVGAKLPKWLGGASLGQVGYDAVTTGANMAPSIMTSVVVGMLNPVAGQVVGNALMGTSAAGNAYQEMLNYGYDKDQARTYATLVGASEAGLQYLLGGFGQMGGKLSGGIITKMMNGVDNAFLRTAIKLGGNMASEGLEEGLQEVLTPWFKNLVFYTDEDVNWSEVAYSSLLGALTAGFMEGGGTIAGEVNTYRTGRALQNADISAQRLSEIGKTFAADTVAYQLAGRVNENTGAYTMGRLFNEIGATLTEQNVNDITQALMAKGMTSKDAKANARAMAVVVEGGNLTDAQVKIIEANDVLADAVRTTIIDSNATWFQRTKGYNEALMALAQEKTSGKKQSAPGQENAPASDTVDATKENGAESVAESSTDISPVKVRSIADIKNGKTTVKLENETEVDVRDADIDPDDGVRIETIASIDGISVTDANFVMNTLRESPNASAQMDALGAKEAYKYGFYGFSEEHLTKHGVFANSLTATQRKAIYETGKSARQRQVEKTTPKNATGAAKQTGIYFDSGSGNVTAFHGSDMKGLSDKQKAGVQAALVMKKLGIGGDIVFFESYLNENGQRVYKDKNGKEVKAPNGWYSKDDGSIHIDLNAGNKGGGFVLFTLAHELTHFIEQWSPTKYKLLADFLVENYEKGQSMDKLVRAKQDKLSANRGKKVSYREAYSEVVANSMEAMLADGNVLEKLVELRARDNALFTKMKQFFDNLVAKIRNIYKGLTPDSDEANMVLEMKDSFEQIQQIFAEALVEASENFQMAEKNTTDDGGVQYSFIGRAADGSGIYKTNYPLNTPKSVKQADLIKLVQDVWSNKPITLTIVEDGRYVDITAKFNPELKERSDLSKIAFGNRKGRAAEQRMTLDLASDLYQIASEARYRYSKNAIPKPNNPAHDGVTKYHYFLTNLVYKDNDGNYIQCHMNIDVKHNAEGDWFYSFAIEKGSVPQALLAAGTEESATLPNPIIQSTGDVVKSESTEEMGIEVDEDTESASPTVFMSERTWTESDYVQEREKAAKDIAKAIGVSEKKAKAYIDSVNSIAKMIADDRTRLDYFSSPNRSSFVGNVEYGGSFDFSTLCKKRRLLTGTFTAIQKALPNTALTANEILDIRNRMKEAGLEVSCGLCYVEGSRANMGQFAKEFLKLYKQYYPDAWQPNMADVNTPEGIEWVRINHPEVYDQYEYFWNHYGTLKPGDKNLFASQQKPKLYQLHTEYKGEILQKFKDEDNIEEKNLNGGIRLQSFSDFEIVHLIDTMQIIMDMSRVGLAGQAYTKVPDFAWALGDTGLKINLSLIAKGVDENGNLIFDDVEGMPIDTAVALRNRYSKNVGTILVAFNDEQLLAAMADDRVDFIIPFHRSQWKKSQYAAMGLPAKTKDYTYMQNEKFIKPQYHEYRGRMVKDKATNYMPNEYWDFSKSGKENAEAYLEMCARNNKRPKFYKLLKNNGDGSYSLKADGSTDGYWKLLIDFKMYDNEGNGSPQIPVAPNFNMEEAQRMLNDYQGGHSSFPVAQGIVDDFVNEYKESHKGVQYSDRDYVAYDHTAILKESKVDEYLMDSASKSSPKYAKAYIAYMSPTSFLKLTTEDWRERDHISSQAGELDEERLSKSKPGIYLRVDPETGKVIGHEGRHRMSAMDRAGIYYVPVLLFHDSNNMGKTDVAEMDLRGQFNEYETRTVKDAIPLSFENRDRIIKKFATQSSTQRVGEKIGYNKTLRFSDRDTESVSNRSLLANAFEGVAQNDIERNKIQEYREKIDLINAEERKLSELREQIKELSFAKGPKDMKRIRSLQFDANQAANRINTYDRQLLRLEASKPLQDVLTREKELARKRAEKKGKEALEAYRERATKTQRELLDRYKESQKRVAEGREKTAMRHKIQNVVGELNQLLLSNDKKHHVPDSLKKAVADALSLVNMDTVGAEERAAKYAALIAKETDPDKIDAYTVTMENILRQGEKMGQRLKELRDAYEEIQDSTDPDIANAYDPVIAGCLNELSKSIGNTSLRNMSIEQLSDVYDMYRMVLTRVRDANKTLLDNIKESISNLSSRVIGEVRITGGEHKYRAAMLDPVRKFLWNNLKPVYAMEWIGSPTLTRVFNNVRAGEDVWAKDVTEARSYYLDKAKKYGYNSWDFNKKYRFESNSGISFDLTLEQILSLYAYSKREQAHDHLRLGGFVFDSNIETYTEQGSKIIKYKVNTADAHQITPEILADITGKLSNDQKQFVDEMQEYLSTVMGTKGNEVTMKMYGVKLFKEKFYFPLKSAKQFMFEQNEVSGEVRIKNSGFTNKVVAKANNPVILSNFMDVWANHVNDMSMYHAFVLPLEDFNRVFNYNSPKQEGQPPVSVKGTIQNAYGPASVGYVKQLITDLNGGARTDSTTGFINKMMGMFKKGAVFASLSVVIQQPSAIARAVALVDTKYFIGPKIDHKRHKALWEEVKKYAPVAAIKEMGYFDTNMGKSTQDYILGKEYSGFVEKMKAMVTDSGYRDEVLSKAPALADEIAWCGIWEAVKREMHHKYPGLDVKSEPFLKLAGSRFTEVITKTQVYDSVLSRSANMRSKDTGMKMATAFMAEPTTSINMIADALLQAKRGNKKYCRAAIGAVIASQILNSVLVSFVYAARDDDEDESYWEKYIGTLTGAMLDSLNPASYIPFIKDIVSIVQGYDVERSDMAVISDLWKAWENLSKDTISPYRKFEGFVGSICQIFGLPAKNIMRDGRAIYQTVMSFVEGRQTTQTGIGYAVKSALPQWMGGGEVSKQDQLYEAYVTGDETHISRVEARYKDQDAVKAAMRSAIKERYISGEIDAQTAAKYLVLYGGMDGSEAHWKLEEWDFSKTKEDGEEFRKYDEFFEAVTTGKNLKTVIKEYTDNGVEMETLKTQITTNFKPKYVEMSVAERANIKGYLLNALVLCGDDREKAEAKLKSWDFEAKYGYAYEDRDDAYKSGAISRSEMVSILVNGGKTPEEADLQVQVYDWEAQGYEGATMAAVREYNENCAALNVPKDIYLYIRKFDDETDNDVVDGKPVNYSAMKKIMAEIDAQYGLSPAQKTAIARSLGWSEKNIKKYKLW